MIFQYKKYQVVKNAISYELANFIFNYFLLKRDAVKFMYENNITWNNDMLGTWQIYKFLTHILFILTM